MSEPVEHTVEIWEVDKLVPYEANAKLHEPEQVEKLAKSISVYGWTAPIVIWTNGEIIAGHGRRLAAIKLGLKRVPVIVRRDLTKPQADALRLADNRVVSTQYNQALQQEEMRRLLGEDIDLLTLGYDEKEIDFISADLGEMDSDFFVEDIGEAVEEQRDQNTEAAQNTDDIAAPVADALGFKRVTIAQSRQLRDLMSRVEKAANVTGPDALIKALDVFLSTQP